MAATLRETVLERNWEATLMARREGEGGAAPILDLVSHDDPMVRVLATTCLGEAGGSDARSALTEALLDENAQVRAAAVAGLHANPDPALYQRLIEIFDESQDRYVRQQIPMIVGRNDDKISDTAPLVERWEREENEEVIEGSVVGLARLSDENARSQFVGRLHSSAGAERDRYLRHCEYINQRWLLKPLGPILLDVAVLRRIGPEHRAVHLRACDIAVNLSAEISGRRFSFKIDEMTNYAEGQIQEVKGYLDGLSE